LFDLGGEELGFGINSHFVSGRYMDGNWGGGSKVYKGNVDACMDAGWEEGKVECEHGDKEEFFRNWAEYRGKYH
jgi:hypothetical protein